VVVTFHWGRPLQAGAFPQSSRQSTICHRLRRSCGRGRHHPHIVQELEIYRRCPIFLQHWKFRLWFWGTAEAEGLMLGFRLKKPGRWLTSTRYTSKNRDFRVNYQPRS